MNSSINREKAFNKIQYPFMIKTKKPTHKKVGIKKFLNLIKAIYKKALQYANGERHAFPLRMEERQNYLFSPLLFKLCWNS